jgi:hypothetical protein
MRLWVRWRGWRYDLWWSEEPPDGDVGDEVGVCKHVIERDKGGGREEFVDVFECVDD